MDFEILPGPGRMIGRIAISKAKGIWYDHDGRPHGPGYPKSLLEFREELWQDRGSVDDFWAPDKFGRSVCSSCGMAHGHSVYCRREIYAEMALALEILESQVLDLERAGKRRNEIRDRLFWAATGIIVFFMILLNLLVTMGA